MHNGNDKELTMSKMVMTKAGGTDNGKSGPTGSARAYPKGKGVGSPSFNPQKIAATTWAVDGV